MPPQKSYPSGFSGAPQRGSRDGLDDGRGDFVDFVGLGVLAFADGAGTGRTSAGTALELGAGVAATATSAPPTGSDGFESMSAAGTSNAMPAATATVRRPPGTNDRSRACAGVATAGRNGLSCVVLGDQLVELGEHRRTLLDRVGERQRAA